MIVRKMGGTRQVRLSRWFWFAYRDHEFWFRLFGRGLLFSDLRRYPQSFSQRMKIHRSFRLGPLAVSVLLN